MLAQPAVCSGVRSQVDTAQPLLDNRCATKDAFVGAFKDETKVGEHRLIMRRSPANLVASILLAKLKVLFFEVLQWHEVVRCIFELGVFGLRQEGVQHVGGQLDGIAPIYQLLAEDTRRPDVLVAKLPQRFVIEVNPLPLEQVNVGLELGKEVRVAVEDLLVEFDHEEAPVDGTRSVLVVWQLVAEPEERGRPLC